MIRIPVVSDGGGPVAPPKHVVVVWSEDELLQLPIFGGIVYCSVKQFFGVIFPDLSEIH